MIVLTGDTHRDFDRIEVFCEENCTTKDDVLIILGDAGINFFLDESDENLKGWLSGLPITFFCVHGNHEERPFNIDTYEEQPWHGGLVYMEPKFPSLLFAKDGEIYDFGGSKAVVLGGAYSVDKFYRLYHGAPWFPDEQPDEEISGTPRRSLKKRAGAWTMCFPTPRRCNTSRATRLCPASTRARWTSPRRSGWTASRSGSPTTSGSAGITTSTIRRGQSASCRTNSLSWTQMACGSKW